jgi:hypothetical protein
VLKLQRWILLVQRDYLYDLHLVVFDLQWIGNHLSELYRWESFEREYLY